MRGGKEHRISSMLVRHRSLLQSCQAGEVILQRLECDLVDAPGVVAPADGVGLGQLCSLHDAAQRVGRQ